MLKRLYEFRKKIDELDEKFFYWRKAQSPQDVAAFYFKLKFICVTAAIVGAAVIFAHSSYISRQEAEALRVAEEAQVEQRRRASRKKRKTVRQVSLPADALNESELIIR